MFKHISCRFAILLIGIALFAVSSLVLNQRSSAHASGPVRLAGVTGAGTATATSTWTFVPTYTPQTTPTLTASGTVSPTPICTHTWEIIPDANVLTNSGLTSVSAISAQDIWAVGNFTPLTGSRPLAEHWDGEQWSFMDDGLQGGSLDAVAAVSTNDVWAVGAGGTSDGSALIVHMEDNHWNEVPSPAPPAGILDYELRSITVISASDIWAVGYGSFPNVGRTLTEHWDGSRWSVIPSPNTIDWINILESVAAVSPNNVWAVGNTGIMHWDGSQWRYVDTDVGGLYGVSAVSSNDVWAVGVSATLDGNYRTLTVHWDGTQWTRVPSPNPGPSNTLNRVSALSPTDAWAVGSYAYGNNGPSYTLIEHWNGTEWSVFPSPNPQPQPDALYLGGLTVDPQGNVWSVGSYGTYTPPTSHSLVLRYASGNPFLDVTYKDYYYNAVRYLYCLGAISGYGNSTFHPSENTTRAQLCKIVVLAAGLPINTQGGPHFSDVPRNQPLYVYVETAYNAGIISGYGDRTFHPDNNVTRGQLCKLIVLAEQWAFCYGCPPNFRDVHADNPYYYYIYTAEFYRIISGYDCGVGCSEFRPNNPATRGQVSKVVFGAVTAPRAHLRK